MLYRLRFNGEQRPFDVVSFMYILPLLTLVLQRGGIGRPARDEADEQITLAVECLSYHAHLCISLFTPHPSVVMLVSLLIPCSFWSKFASQKRVTVAHCISSKLSPALPHSQRLHVKCRTCDWSELNNLRN